MSERLAQYLKCFQLLLTLFINPSTAKRSQFYENCVVSHLCVAMSEVRVQITDQGNHPPKLVEDIKKCLIESQSFGPLDIGEMKKLLPRKLKQNVDTGEMYSFWIMYVEQLRAGVFLIIIIIKKHAGLDDSVSRILAKA